MKHKHLQNTFGSILGLWLVFAPGSSPGGVAVSITPPAVSSAYGGNVSLQVTGLNPGSRVVVQKYLDANANGAVDGQDLLWQQFNLADGQASTIGGVTNFNVPGDTDGTAGQITAQLNLQGDFLQAVVGAYLFVVSSPTGQFAPLTNVFAVTNFPYAQQLSGTVLNTGTNVPNALVLLFQPSGGGLNPTTGALADNSGGYVIKAPPGTYTLVPFKTNFVSNGGASPSVTLGSGQSIVTNLGGSLITATQSISGKVVDASDSSIGLPGVLMPVQASGALLSVSWTDTNGSFVSRTIAGQWKVATSGQSLDTLGYLRPQDNPRVNTTTGSVAGVTIALPKETGLFYGTVKDVAGNPMAHVQLYSQDDTTFLYEADSVYTDQNGNYAAGTLTGVWSIGISTDGNPSSGNYAFSPGTQHTFSAGQAYRYNFTAVLATNHIAGHVQFNGGPVTGAQVIANTTLAGTNYQTQIDTDGTGNYSLNVANGNWTVSLSCQGGSDSLDGLLGPANYQCPGSQQVSINNNNGVANFDIQPAGGGYQIFGFVTDGLGGPVVGVDVHADNGVGTTYTSPTDSTGFYSINVGNGGWHVSVDCAELTTLGYGCVDQQVNVSGSSVEADFTVTAGGSPLEITTISLPNGNVGAGYGGQLIASGGQSPYAWSLAIGSANLPPGLALNSGGLITGVPTTNGLFPFKVQVTDMNSASTNKDLAMIINPRPAISLPGWRTNQFQLRLVGASNQNYTVQVTTNLTSTNWTTLSVVSSPSTNMFTVTDGTATNKQRFYRVLIGP